MNEVEPRVDTVSLAVVVRRQIDQYGYDPTSIIERAGVSIDTLRRLLRGDWKKTISLDEGDRLLVASGGHISEVKLVDQHGNEVE